MEKTHTLLRVTFGKDISGVILEYVMAINRDDYNITKAGEWETCERGLINWNWGLWGACKGGHLKLVKLMISHGTNKCSNVGKHHHNLLWRVTPFFCK